MYVNRKKLLSTLKDLGIVDLFRQNKVTFGQVQSSHFYAKADTNTLWYNHSPRPRHCWHWGTADCRVAFPGKLLVLAELFTGSAINNWRTKRLGSKLEMNYHCAFLQQPKTHRVIRSKFGIKNGKAKRNAWLVTGILESLINWADKTEVIWNKKDI